MLTLYHAAQEQLSRAPHLEFFSVFFTAGEVYWFSLKSKEGVLIDPKRK